MIIGINGKIGSGKDTVGKIIQYLTNTNGVTSWEVWCSLKAKNNNWQIKKFADKLKDMVCLLIGCTREQLEDQDFKNKELGEDWWYFKGRNGALIPYNKDSKRSNEDLIKLTPRLLLQLLGTECGREIIHPNTWVNSLFSDYKCDLDLPFKVFWDTPLIENHVYVDHEGNKYIAKYPNWVITDLRFPNELEAIKTRKGITIRVNSPEFYYLNTITNEVEKHRIGMMNKIDYPYLTPLENTDQRVLNSKYFHISETSLDNATFDYVIDNNSNIEDLIEKVRKILINEKII